MGWVRLGDYAMHPNGRVAYFTGFKFIEAPKEKSVGHPRSIWKHKKYRAREYNGHYRRSWKEREFILTGLTADGKKHTISFESHEAAKSLGWVRAPMSLNRNKTKPRSKK